MEKRRNREDRRGSPCKEGNEWPLFIKNKTGGVEGDNEGWQEEGNQCNLPWQQQQGVIYGKGMAMGKFGDCRNNMASASICTGATNN